MTSPPPLLFGTHYHIFNRGVNRENIFIEERNYEYFLKLYEKHIEPVVDTFGYCLLRNHFHLVIRVKSKDEIQSQIQTQSLKVSETFRDSYASKKFSDFFNAYAKAINKAYDRTGSLFQHPFRRVPIATDHQFWNVIAYIHQNPQKHGFVEDFRDWKYSSYGIMIADSPTHLQRNVVLDWFGGKEEYLRLHSVWVNEAQRKWFDEDL